MPLVNTKENGVKLQRIKFGSNLMNSKQKTIEV